MNITIHHQWASLFISHMDLESQLFYFSDVTFNNLDFDSELHCTPIELIIHDFLEVPKILDNEIIIYCITLSQHFHHLKLI